jgi:ATP-dependent helicase/DNAse subunit B
VVAGVERLVIAEIYDYSPAQSLIARALIQLVGDAELVTLAHPQNVDASRFVELTWNRFVDDPDVADKVLPDFVVRGGRVGTLSRVLGAVFAEPKPPPAAQSDGRVRIVAAPSRTAEVVEVGRRVRAALAAGVAPERIAILALSLRAYRPLLEDMARRQRLPLVFREPRGLGEHGSVQAVVRLAHAVADGLPRDVVVAALESPYFADAPPGVRAVLAAVGYVDGATMPLAECMARSERPASDSRRTQATDRRRRHAPGVAAAVQRLAALGRARTVAAHAAALRAALGELGWTLPGTDAIVGEAASEGVALAALDRLLGELAETAGAAGERPIAFARFLALLESAIELGEADGPGPAAAGVRVLPIADARGLDFDDVFLLGLDDGTFPAAVREDGMLPDAARRAVNRDGPAEVLRTLATVTTPAALGRLLRLRADRAAEDPFLFYLALSTAEQRVVVTYPLRDDDGGLLVRSPFIDELTSIVGEAVETSPAETAAIETAADAGALLSAAVTAAVAGQPGVLAAAATRVPADVLRHLLTRIRTERRRARYFLLDGARDREAKDALADAFVGRLAPDETRRERLRLAPWSATALDELGACGFRFFARRVLRLGQVTAGNETLDVREQGLLVHRLLEMVLRAADPLPSDPGAAAAWARSVAESLRPTIAAELRPADARLFDLAWAEAVRAVAEVVADEAVEPARGDAIRQRLLEWRFRFTIPDHRACPPAERLDVGIDGKLDRADVWIDGAGRVVAARVLDYKNSKRERSHNARLDPAGALGTMSFQIPLYAMALKAASDLTWEAQAEIEGGYVLLRGGRKLLMREMPQALLALTPETGRAPGGDQEAPIASRVVDLVADAVAGRFDVEPRECDPYCAYRHTCRYEPPPEEDE